MKSSARIWVVLAIIAATILVVPSILGWASNPDVVSAADSEWSRRSEPNMADAIIKTLEEASRVGAPDADVMWRLARAYWWKAARYTSDRAAKIELLDKGKAAGEQATKLDPNDADAHYWHAATVAQAGQIKGILQSLFMVKPVKEALDKALAADPNHASSHYLMAELLSQVPGPPLSIGNKQKAVEEARLAVKFDPKESCHHLVLAKALIATKQYKEARGVLNFVLSMPLDIADPEGTRLDQEEARAELKSIQGK